MALSLPKHTAWRKVAGETFVVDLRNNTMFGLNRPAGEVWQCIEKGIELSEIVAHLAPEAVDETAKVVLRSAVEVFLEEMISLGLIDGRLEEVAEPIPTPCNIVAMEAPKVVWREELRAFGASCGKDNGTDEACVQAPFS